MRRKLASMLVGVIVLTAIAVAAMTRSAPAPADAPKVAAPVSPPTAGGVETKGPVVHVVDYAMKDLDLIRPARSKIADDFTLKTADGGTFRLHEQRGKVVLVNFWATWCPPCLEEMPAMQRLYDRHRHAPFLMLAVSVDADSRLVAPFLKEQKFTFTVGLDPKMELANAYGVRGLPSSFIVDREGHLAALALGPRRWDTTAAHTLVDGMSR